jgi:chromosomal replication initiation ATPase DnaA
MTRQLALDLPLRTARGRADFFAAPSNAVALAAVEGWRSWPGGRMLLVGPRGSGKTHLAQVWAELCPGARLLPASALPGAEIPALATAPLAVEDAEGLAGDAEGETALFHLHNLMGAQGQPLLLTAGQAPGLWPTVLPDLASRLQAMAVARLEPPCDTLLSAVLVKLFADRQIAVAPALVAWLLPRIERSLSGAADIVARLDAAALAAGRAVTVPLAAQVLDSAGAEGQDDGPAHPEHP